MDKETHKKLTANFPKSVVKKAPKGKFGKYVPHHIYTQRLVDVVGGKYNFYVKETVRDKNNAVVGAVCRLEIEGLGVVEEIGDVDTTQINRKQGITESEILKLAVSDGIKRCCMRFGIGLELWTGDTTEEEHYAGEVEQVVEQPKKKEIAQEITKSPSSLTEPQLKEMVFSMCNEDKDFAKKCYQTQMTRFKMDKSISDNVGDWSNDNVDKFLKLVEDYVDKFKNEFEKRAGNTEVVNNIIETLGNVKEKESEENMTDIPSGTWEQDPPTDRQLNTFNDKVAQATDNGQTELVKKAKDFLASGKATKGNIFDWIDTEGDWTLKDGS